MKTSPRLTTLSLCQALDGRDVTRTRSKEGGGGGEDARDLGKEANLSAQPPRIF